MAIIRKFTKRFFIVSNWAVAVIFLIACSNAYLHVRWWYISLLSLIFPLLLLLVIGFLIFWLFFHSRRLSLISAFALLIGIPNIHALFALSVHGPFKETKSPEVLRVMTWNVHSWDEFITKKSGASGHRLKMMDFIRDQNADVLCFQEFFEPMAYKTLPVNVEYIRQTLHYPYFFYSRDFTRRDSTYTNGVVIFSRYPIVDSSKIKFHVPPDVASRYIESLLYTDINVNGKIVRIHTAHLQSVLFRSKDFRDMEIIKNADDQMLEASKSILKKLRFAYALRSEQADLIRENLDKSPYPGIMCGDFNDVPNSYVYFRVKGDRQDAFIKKGFGIGRSYIHLSPTLRIDYIMADKRLEVIQCKKFNPPYSDHHPIIADFKIP